MVRQLHIVAEPLPDVVDDRHVVHAVVLEIAQVVGAALEGALVVPPHIQHDAVAQELQIGRGLPGDVREHLADGRRDRDVALFEQRVAGAVGLRVVVRLAAGAGRGVSDLPVQAAAHVDSRGGEIEQRPAIGEVGDRHGAAQRRLRHPPQRQPHQHRLLTLRPDRQRLAHHAEGPSHGHRLAREGVLTGDLQRAALQHGCLLPAGQQHALDAIALLRLGEHAALGRRNESRALIHDAREVR